MTLPDEDRYAYEYKEEETKGDIVFEIIGIIILIWFVFMFVKRAF